MKLRIAFVILSALVLSSCQPPRYTWIVNATSERLTILEAFPLGMIDAPNMANASPWYWPFRSKPVLDGFAGAYRLSSYGPFDHGWRIKVQLANRCRMSFEIPSAPSDTYDRPDWRIYTAYREAALQVNDDQRIYRIPTLGPGGSPADVTRLDQPEGYPLAPTESDC